MPDPDDSGMNEFVARACAAADFEQRIAHLTTEAHVAFSITAAGRAVCVLYPIGTARDGLATLTLTGNPLRRELVLAWRADSPVAAAVDDLRDCRDRLAAAGALVGSSDHGATKGLYAKDPDGLEFEVCWLVPHHLVTQEVLAHNGELDIEADVERYGEDTVGACARVS